MTGRQLSNIMEYHVRTDAGRIVLEASPPSAPCLPPPRWRAMTGEDTALLATGNMAIALSDDARITSAPPCARSASGLPATATLILATPCGEYATLLDRLEQAIAVAIQDGADGAELIHELVKRGWSDSAVVSAVSRLAETGGLLIRA